MYGVIDIGSNSVRLMLSGGIKTISKESMVTKLAMGETDSILSNQSMDRTATAVAIFVDKAKSLGITPYVFATAAVRNAKNGFEFAKRLENECGVKVDVVSGELEAELGLNGALNGCDGGIIDIGGGSTEIAVVKNGKKVYGKSVNIGCVKLLNISGSDRVKAEQYIEERLIEYGNIEKANFYAIGGSATSLAGVMLQLVPYDRNKTHGFKLYKDKVKFWADKLFNMTLEERKNIIGLQPQRIETIPFGTLALFMIMEKFDIPYVTVSENDNLEGYLSYILNDKNE